MLFRPGVNNVKKHVKIVTCMFGSYRTLRPGVTFMKHKRTNPKGTRNDFELNTFFFFTAASELDGSNLCIEDWGIRHHREYELCTFQNCNYKYQHLPTYNLKLPGRPLNTTAVTRIQVFRLSRLLSVRVITRNKAS